jgi:predicted DNA-binding ribbon-helix-helix protein
MAAPRKSYKDQKIRVIDVYLTHEFYEKLKQIAEDKGCGVSTLARQLAIEYTDEFMDKINQKNGRPK